jgi:hypothetical protein
LELGVVEQWSVESSHSCFGIAGNDERRTFNAQHRMLNEKKQGFYWTFDVECSLILYAAF